jgi:hypothetical protein
LAYQLAADASPAEVKAVRGTLTKDLKRAIAAALNEPKQGLVADSADGARVRRLVSAAGAKSFEQRLESWINHASHWSRSVLGPLDQLSDALDRAENQVGNQTLGAAVERLQTACVDASNLAGYKYFTDELDTTKMFLKAKAIRQAQGHYDRYDEDLQAQLDHAREVLRSLRDAWRSFVKCALDLHPDLGELFE